MDGERQLPHDDRRLPAAHHSLAFGVADSTAGGLHALTVTGGVQVRPRPGRTLLFGRNRPDVDICVGEYDRTVSRRHGSLTYEAGRWWLLNDGRTPIRLPGSRWLFAGEEPVPLDDGYTPLFVRGSGDREHLLEVHVIGAGGRAPVSRHGDVTNPPRTWRLDDSERLALVVLGQRYLLHERRPQPLSWQQAAAQLAELRPEDGWTPKRLEHAVAAVRARLSRRGVAGLTREEVGQPVGNTLNDNLLTELVLSTTLVPPDLESLG